MKIKISTAGQLSTHFKSLRKAKGWSQADLGKRIGLKQARVAQIEGDPGAISVDKLLQVLQALEADFVIETQETAPEQASTASVQRPAWYDAVRKALISDLGKSPARSLNLISTPTEQDHFPRHISTKLGSDEKVPAETKPQTKGKTIKKTKD